MSRLFAALLATLTLSSAALAQTPHGGDQPKPARPAVFSDKPYAEALAATKGNSKIFIVKATASWCPPCKMMDRTTFLDENVIKWFGDNGLVIDFDVDKNAELAQSLHIRAMPTTIAYKNGEEVDRIVGYRDGPGFLGWLNDVKAGKRSGEDLQVKVEKAGKGEGEATARERYQNFGNMLTAERDLDKATEEAVWLWNNMAKEEPSLLGVRSSFFATEVSRLVKLHPAAAEPFTKIRDEAWDGYKADSKNLAALSDWAVLNESLDQSGKTLEWFDAANTDPANATALRRLSFRLERLLTDKGRTADICRIYPDPIQKLQDDDRMRKSMPKLSDDAQNKSMHETQDRMFRDGASRLYASLLLAKRDRDAESFLAEATKLDDTGAMRAALVRAAVDNRAGHKGLYPVLDAAEKAGEAAGELRAQLASQAGKP